MILKDAARKVEQREPDGQLSTAVFLGKLKEATATPEGRKWFEDMLRVMNEGKTGR